MAGAPAIDRKRPLEETGLDLLFRDAQSYNGWRPEPISGDEIRREWIH